MPPLFPSWMDVHRVEVKLDKLLELNHIVLDREAFIIHQENTIMTTLADIDELTATTLAKVNAEADPIAAIATIVSDIKAQNVLLLQELADAQASGNQAAIDTAMANLTAANAKLDANALALAAVNPPATPAAPTVTGVSPNTGPAAGGTAITISGTGFTSATGLAIGGTPVPSMTISSDTSITATTPAGTVGDATVVVSAGALASAPGVFTYTA